ncbi:molybdate ABC transporter substrate-binding protein [Paenibacillus sp.]|uniref:molybdate ABC transporter substrate-binding protein n=1 Tax=Paenibacillus sp. TaxID=58172 RepID=UPI002D491E29|nr:molybdate ABC transporter substrate-binding protein [Paenibacillus sp.]HZG83888.1 molybdate ABC transporter substrate-binding protein [Paenibacillus sp.]
MRGTARLRRRWIAGLAALLIASGCASAPPPAVSSSGDNGGEAVELLVSAAASLKNAMEDIEAAYERKRPSVDIVYNFGASGALQRQIEQGAPVDVFLSAAAKPMEALIERKLIEPDRVEPLLTNELVLVVPADRGAAIGSLADLSGEGIRNIAIGIPGSVPAGGYAQEALSAAGLWEELAPKIVQAKDVRQVLQYVETGNADAGFVYKTDALTSKKAVIAAVVDPLLHEPIVYPAGVLNAAKHAAESEEFLLYLRSEEAADVFAKYGFAAWEPS